MAESVESRLKSLGIVLHRPAPVQGANYLPTVVAGRQVFVSGQVSIIPDGARMVGKVGADLSVEEGRQGAHLCAINILANLVAAIGSFDRLERIVKLTGFVNCAPDFTEPHRVVNGASDLLVEVLGDRGRHARTSIGVATLPVGAAVEVEAIAALA
jgi:enamine deaminase RidA (YjgF/YER057c/UK114 family)